jgi:hypothetical protein
MLLPVQLRAVVEELEFGADDWRPYIVAREVRRSC